MGNHRAISKTSVVTEAVTKPSPAVTGAKKAVIATLSAEQRHQAKLMHAALVVAFGVATRDKVRIGPAGFRTLWPETRAEWMDRAPEQTFVAERPATKDEVSIADMVLPALLQEFANERFHAQLLVGRALGVKWGRVMRHDPKRRGERMVKYLHQWLLYRLWCRVPALQSLLHRLQQL